MHVHYVCVVIDGADKIRAQLVCSPPVADCCCQSLGIRLWLHGVTPIMFAYSKNGGWVSGSDINIFAPLQAPCESSLYRSNFNVWSSANLLCTIPFLTLAIRSPPVWSFVLWRSINTPWGPIEGRRRSNFKYINRISG